MIIKDVGDLVGPSVSILSAQTSRVLSPANWLMIWCPGLSLHTDAKAQDKDCFIGRYLSGNIWLYRLSHVLTENRSNFHHLGVVANNSVTICAQTWANLSFYTDLEDPEGNIYKPLKDDPICCKYLMKRFLWESWKAFVSIISTFAYCFKTSA